MHSVLIKGGVLILGVTLKIGSHESLKGSSPVPTQAHLQCNQAREQNFLFSGFQRILAYKIETI